MKVTIHVDGGARGNPGPAGAGFVIRAADDGTSLAEVGVFIPHATNNVAEYTALVEGLKRAEMLGVTHADIYSDSQLMVRQILGEYRVKNAGLKPLFDHVGTLLRRLEEYRITHVRREENTDADRMANKAMDAKRMVEE